MLRKNCKEFGVPLFDLGDSRQGIVHIIGPELGLTQPGMTIVCGDSHTATHGALGALAFGIGTSEVEHVLATQCLWQEKPRSMEVRIDGHLAPGVGAKDLILGIIGRITTNGGTGYVIEYRGPAIEALSMEERMTVCNMSIEGGARAGMVAPDRKTIDYVRGRRYVPEGAAFDQLARRWLELRTDDGAKFDRSIVFHGQLNLPRKSPGAPIRGWLPTCPRAFPIPTSFDDATQRRATELALDYMALASRHSDRGHQDRSRLYRLMHQRAAERPSGRRRDRQGPPRGLDRPCDGRAGLAAGQSSRPKNSASTASLRRRASNGASPDAACASA